MQKIWNVAPPATWAILGLAAVLLLAGFVLLSHTLVRAKAYGDRYGGPAHAGVLELTVRAGAACVLAGGALWAVELGAPATVIWGLGGLAAVSAGLELVARLKT